MHASKRRVPWLAIGAAALALILLALLAVDGFATSDQVRSRADSGSKKLQDGVALLHGLTAANASVRLAAARLDFRRASEDYASARQDLAGNALASLAVRFPGPGEDVVTATSLLGVVGKISDFAGAATALGQDAAGLTARKTTRSPGEQAAAFLDAHRVSVQELTRMLDAIKADRAALSPSASTGRFGPAVKELDAKLARLEDAWKDVPTQLLAIRSLLGVDKPTTYLVVSLDSAELRSAGGFIGSFGLLRISHGVVSPIQFRTIDSLHEPLPKPGDPWYLTPPLPIARHLFAGSLSLRDATWWPDFPTSAAVIEQKLKEDEGTSVDGVIGIDPALIASLLRIAGPVTVPRVSGPFTAENFYIKSLLQAGGIKGGTDRKDFLQYIGVVLQQRLLALPGSRLTTLSDTVHQACLRRDLQISLHDAAAMAMISRLGCTGAMVRTKGDYLFVVSAVSGAKNNAWLQRRMALTIGRAPAGMVRHALTLHFVNAAPVNLPTIARGYITPFYDDYLRIFIPPGSTWIGTTGALDEQVFVAVSDAGYAEIGGHFRTINNVFDVTLTYDVPVRSATDLLWERQSGTGDDPVTVVVESGKRQTVRFTLDKNYLLALSP